MESTVSMMYSENSNVMGQTYFDLYVYTMYTYIYTFMYNKTFLLIIFSVLAKLQHSMLQYGKFALK